MLALIPCLNESMNPTLNISRIVKVTVIMFIVSFYFFPIGFRGLPPSLNTKQILGVVGIAFYVLKCINDKAVVLPKNIFVPLVISVIFSCWCYYSTMVNNTNDYAYASYILSFSVWLGGAYAVSEIIRLGHGYADVSLLTKYMAAMSLMQCVAVMLVNYVPAVQDIVDAYIIQDTVPKNVGRLYGLGCSLDSGGVRFCCVEALIAYQLAGNREVLDNKKELRYYLLSFFIIGVVGSMVARTTSVGLVMCIAYITFVLGYVRQGVISKRQLRFFRTAFWIIVIVTTICIYLYNTNYSVRRFIRFAFEAFFAFFNNGTLTTGSSEILMDMWIWPTDTAGWIHGYGIFSTWGQFATDIGYCRFTNYCGLVGLGIFSIFFVYNSISVARKFDNAVLFSLLLLAIVFVVWIKVSTDIFPVYALLLCVDSRRRVRSW